MQCKNTKDCQKEKVKQGKEELGEIGKRGGRNGYAM